MLKSCVSMLRGRSEQRARVSAAGADHEAYDVLSRFFTPWHGIDEDSATGSAHCVLGPLFAELLGKCSGIRCRQCSRRGGELVLDMHSDQHMVSITAIASIRASGRLHGSHSTALHDNK